MDAAEFEKALVEAFAPAVEEGVVAKKTTETQINLPRFLVFPHKGGAWNTRTIMVTVTEHGRGAQASVEALAAPVTTPGEHGEQPSGDAEWVVLPDAVAHLFVPKAE